MQNYDAIVIGIGHAGVEASIALATKNHKTLALSISLDNAGFLACNPSIGGTAKGHLVCEVDALGGVMGKAADSTTTHVRMLNSSKGAAVQSLRAQVDKYKYHDYIKGLLESTPNLTLRQAEAVEILTRSGKVIGVKTRVGQTYKAKVVIVATGVYLESSIIIGDVIEQAGPSGFARSNHLADSLRNLGFILRRFKTGTPARVNRKTVDLDKLNVQPSENVAYSFSSEKMRSEREEGILNDSKEEQSTNLNLDLPKSISNTSSLSSTMCYLGYTNQSTHDLITKNLQKSPKYAGIIKGAGARYCPSVEDKVVRFTDKERHPFFLEPEGAKTNEMYVQGLSTGLPADIQLGLYRSIKGFENVEIMRDAYAIEYECIDPTELYASLESKAVKGLYFAGQINGTSGYEEAAAQGLLAGLNAALSLEKKAPVILPREASYIGVLIDDLTTKGTDEPYRMMTSRAEYRLLLRQDNADLRLTEIGYNAGLASNTRLNRLKQKIVDIITVKKLLKERISMKNTNAFFDTIGEPHAHSAVSVEDIVKRNKVNTDNFCAYFDIFNNLNPIAVADVFIECKYAGYIARESMAAAEAKALSEFKIPSNLDYNSVYGLRLEAREKLSKVRPMTIGQASRISGISPADINVLIIKLSNNKGKL